MRVGLLTYGMDGERMTGIARYAIELTRAMKRLQSDLEIVLLSPYPESSHPWYREFPMYPVPNLKLLPAVATVGNWRLHRAALKLRLDILHDPCGIAPFLAPRSSYKRITTIHDAVPFVYPQTQPLLTRSVFRTLLRAARRTADAVITVSEASARDLVKFLALPEGRLHVTPLGVRRPPSLTPYEVKSRCASLGLGPTYILFVGALHPRKNIGRVVGAFQSVRERHPDVQLAVVGPKSWGASGLFQRLETRAAEGTSIVLTGFVSDADLDALYFGALALVFPSLYEGFGLPAVEAMSHGTPVITSQVSSLPEVVGEAALLIDPRSTDAIAAAVENVLEDSELRSRLSELGRLRAAEMSWDATAMATLNIYRSLTQS